MTSKNRGPAPGGIPAAGRVNFGNGEFDNAMYQGLPLVSTLPTLMERTNARLFAVQRPRL